MDDGGASLAWGFDIILGLLVAIVGFFVKQLVGNQTRRSEQLQELTHRITVLEERERGLAVQLAEVKDSVDALLPDLRYVREQIAVLISRAGDGKPSGR